MTYCVAVRVESGLVMASDSRTHAGVDHIATFRKMTSFAASDRLLILLSAGNLATTQSVLSLLQQRLHSQHENLNNVSSMYDAACLIGQTLREVTERDQSREGRDAGVDFSCSFLLGGQITGDTHRLFNIYPQGNFIEATEDTPYLQIGESKYGKPILDRVIEHNTELMEAAKCVLVSFDSTIRSNLSVGLPVDLMIHVSGRLQPALQHRFVDGDLYLVKLREAWSQGLRQLFASIPDLPWGL
ncbi:MAG: proteasome-type protease [Pseudomonadales bacterium]|nr:proteasome-type protease [Pseudomonadales bacterium]